MSSFMRVGDVAKELDCKPPTAYKVIQKLNKELKKQGFNVMSGRVSKEYFLEKYCYERRK